MWFADAAADLLRGFDPAVPLFLADDIGNCCRDEARTAATLAPYYPALPPPPPPLPPRVKCCAAQQHALTRSCVSDQNILRSVLPESGGGCIARIGGVSACSPPPPPPLVPGAATTSSSPSSCADHPAAAPYCTPAALLEPRVTCRPGGVAAAAGGPQPLGRDADDWPPAGPPGPPGTIWPYGAR